MTNLKCPRCLYEYDVRDAAKDKDLVEIIRMMPDFGAHHKLVWEYAELFGTTLPMKWKKMLRLLTEVREVWNSNRFSINKRVYAISREGIAAALRIVCNKSFTEPLQNHIYLMKVMVTVAEAEEAKRSAEAEKAQRQKEAALRAGARPGPVRAHDEGSAGQPTDVKKVLEKMPWRKD